MPASATGWCGRNLRAFNCFEPEIRSFFVWYQTDATARIFPKFSNSQPDRRTGSRFRDRLATLQARQCTGASLEGGSPDRREKRVSVGTNHLFPTNGSQTPHEVALVHTGTQAPSRLFTSWKEIALYLGKGVRTVQRWERELNLPVRRPGNGKHVVLATADDLESWVAQLQRPPRTNACCDCKALLDRANVQIAALREENASLRKLLGG